MKTINVRAAPGGWTVECDLNLWPLAFRSGAAAERQAGRFARALASHGAVIQIVVRDRTGAVVGARICEPGDVD